MDTFKPPGEMRFAIGNVAENWKRWVQKFNNFMLASEKNSKPENVKIAILLNLLGDEGVAIYNTFKSTGGEQLEEVLKCFEEHCNPHQNVVFERYKFFSCKQREGQTFDNYLTQLKTLVTTCDFGDQQESSIRDRIVLGINDSSLQERMLREPSLTLQMAAEFVRAAEASKEQFQSLKGFASSSCINAVKTSVFKNNYKRDKSSGPTYDCKKCGRNHKKGDCPAYGKTCSKCKEKNHFAVGCRKKNIHELEYKNNNSELFIESLSVGQASINNQVNAESTWYKTIQLRVGDKTTEIKFKLDTGAETNVLSYNMVKHLNVNLTKTETVLIAYGNFKIKPMGKVSLECISNDTIMPIEFIIIEKRSTPILGLNAGVKLNLIQRINQITIDNKSDVLKMYETVFEGLGKFPGEEYHIELKPNAVPVIHPPRRVPQALQSRLKETLNRLEADKIISKVNKPTDWVQSLVIVEKPNGSLRLCLDPRDLNRVIKREHHLIPSAEDIISRLEGKKLFTVLDLKDGFWQVPLDNESSDLCTFNTPHGRYKFNVLPFGIASAPEVFQKRNERLFGDIDGVEVYFDDIIVTGTDKVTHDAALTEVLKRAEASNIKFNANKLQFRMTEVKYMGQIISDKGIKADPGHIKGIVDMPTPSSKGEVRRLLGMVNFLSKFIPNLSQITAPLRELIKQNIEFRWENEHTVAFNRIKELLSCAPVLKVFNGSEKITIQCDSSKDGLGTCLIQNGQPVSFLSRSLTECEKNYAQIEKELLAIVFSFQKYHNLVYGRHVIIQSDHKPLTSIVNKPMSKISSRLQRMLLKLLKYDYEVQYVPGNQMYLADTLSRAFKSDNQIKDDPEMSNMVHSITKYLPMSKSRLTQFKHGTDQDKELQTVIKFVKEGWPKVATKNWSRELKQYYKSQSDLHTNEGLLFINDKIVVPNSLRQQMLTLIHEGHFGMEKCKQRAREIMYWPGINRDIETIVSHCEKFRRSNTKEPLQPHSVPDRPFEKIGVDIMEFGNLNYLVVMDYYSKWIEVSELVNKTATEVINVLKETFSRYGIPNFVVSDNIPFNSHVYIDFAKTWDFEYKFSSPHHHQSNGQAERGVGIVKTIMRKAKEDNKNHFVGLMEYRNTPISGLNLSPAQLMFSRRLRTKLPVTNKLLNSEVVNNVKGLLTKRQQIQKQFHDRSAKSLSKLNPGDNVRMKNKTWEPAQVISIDKDLRSYTVKSESGKILKRNRKYLIKSHGELNEMSDYSMSDNDNSMPDNVIRLTNGPTQNKCITMNDTNVTTTRSGRICHKPRYLNDYV
ncbi:Transposon Ty3-G Gag-Pol polyprotein [Araneus ventricosus]|uniref:RNA-directed DNA polymerase n=1 Tax=Araneus ventricosus TaxID=182803 RepID=A0A4Y2M9N8_ARAVE|nr:Transposon Ty3-G Gag-Pol polyprotein [Araneus ventricosus]